MSFFPHDKLRKLPGFAAEARARRQPSGLNDELHRYDFNKLLRAMTDPGLNDEAGFELEVSREIGKARGRQAEGVYIPTAVLARALTVSTAGGSTGGQLVATDLRADKFIDLLRPKSFTAALGVTLLENLVGNVAIPRQTGGAAAYWVTEGNAPTESQAAFDQVPMTPKTIGAYTDISRKMVLQSSISAQGFVANDLTNSLAQAIDYAVIAGSGSGSEPTGLLNNAAVPVHELGTNGEAMTWPDVVAMWLTVAANSADFHALGFLTNPKVRGALMQAEKSAGSGEFVWDAGETLAGRPAFTTSLVPDNLTKGTGTNLSAMIFGNWADIIIGQWGAIDLTVDPYTLATSGGVRLVALLDLDFAVRHPESFVVCKDIITG